MGMVLFFLDLNVDLVMIGFSFHSLSFDAVYGGGAIRWS